MPKNRHLISFVFCAMLSSFSAHADDISPAGNELPEVVRAQIHAPLKQVGEGNYRKFGFKIYHASLWAPEGKWEASKPYALKLEYSRSLSKDTMINAVVDDIREEKVADEATLAHWRDILNASLPAIEENDVIIGLSIPGKNSVLFYNGKKIANIDDKALSDAFFNIWLGPTANESLRANLLGQQDE